MPDIKLTLLSQARIASPCSMRWEDMRGDDKKRHCEACDLHVHNLAAMTEAEAEGLLARHLASGGVERLCAVLYRRADGTVLTRDCPVGFAAVRAAARRRIARCILAIGAVASSAAALGWMPGLPWISNRLRDQDPFARVAEWFDPAQVPILRGPVPGEIVMGKMIVAPPRANPPAQPAADPAQQGGNNEGD